MNDYDFLSGKFTPKEIQLIRKRMVESILMTDMATMKQMREDFQLHLNNRGIQDRKNVDRIIDFTNEKTMEKSKQLVSSVILHSCDISTSLRDFETSITWADLLFEEFFNQGDMEKAQGLEISMMCDRTTTNIAGGQAGFIQFVVLPIFYQLAEISPEIEELQIASGLKNIEKWKVRAEYEREVNEKEDRLNKKLEIIRKEEAQLIFSSGNVSVGKKDEEKEHDFSHH